MITKDQINELKGRYQGQIIYRARNNSYIFDIFDDRWQLDTKDYLCLEWMYTCNFDEQTFIDIRELLAFSAQTLCPNTVKNHIHTLKKVNGSLTINSLKLIWPNLKETDKKKFKHAITKGVEAEISRFMELARFTSNQKVEYKRAIFDPEKGTYTDFEYKSIKDAFRFATDTQLYKLQKNVLTPSKLNQFGILIACQLMNALVRRPSQLRMMKWSDFLPIGERFSDQRVNETNPIEEPLFSDVEKLHVRTFKGKEGTFRGFAETTSHILIPELSTLVLLYRKNYEKTLTLKLEEKGIKLSKVEINTIMLRCPIFFDQSLFSAPFRSKSELFKAIGSNSDAFHKLASTLRTNIQKYTQKLNFNSERIDSDNLKFNNNRIRHFVLTQGAINGLSSPYLAKITGVTEQAVKPYIDLSFDARLDIDEKMAKNQILNRFGQVSVQDIQRQEGFVVKDEFDTEIGILNNHISCTSCKSKLGAPLGCYPCDNFRPHQEADHQRYLEKAIHKYEINKAMDADKATLKRLRTIILYIQATIETCEELNIAEKGVLDV
ncbi:hypothetical protein [Vibrio sp. V23_P3S9T160]|uniref:hypothetical protein n=1 Tax=Vibrio sp. V23_P3S9T160 TaxID=1938675 RepID=UPI001372A8AA|nr:hypothetical protein [Vibrio sp. V23_P3S9T160]NAW98555.1 hypothetical protein [Vibrio sp. V23_P3S9T160]